MNHELEIEAEIHAKGKTAPRLTPAHIDEAIVSENYWIPEFTAMTVCVLTLKNGFRVVGYSHAVSPKNFDEEIGRKIARERAREQIWQLEGYLLKEWLYTSGK